MTIQEIYELIKQKKESAKLDRARKDDKYFYLTGQIDAYTDVICLIESSGVLDEEKNN